MDEVGGERPHGTRLVTDDELERARQEPGGRTLAEILQRRSLSKFVVDALGDG